MPTTYSLDEVLSEGKGKTYSLGEITGNAEIKNSPPPLSTWDRFKRGYVESPLAGIKQLAAETEIASLIAPEWAKRAKQEVQADEQAYQSRRMGGGVDFARLGGEVLNPVNLGLAYATKTPPGMSLAGRTGLGAVGGSLMGAATPTYGNVSRGEQAVLGAVGGALGAPLSAGVARVVKPKVNPDVALLKKEGITPSFGQNFGKIISSSEDKATSIPILGDVLNMSRGKSLDELNLAVYNRALAPVGAKHSGKLGQAGVAEVRKTLSNRYQMTLSGLKMKPDNQFSGEITALDSQVRQMMPSEQNIWNRLLDRLNNRTKTGEIDHTTLKSIHTTLDDVTDKLRRDGSFEKVELADVLDDMRVSLNEAVKRNNPQRQKALDKLDEGWANYSILRDAAFQAEKRKGSGLITPSDLESAVVRSAQRNSSKAAAKGKVTEGNALMQDLSTAALRVLPSQYPDSGTTGRALFAAGGLAGLFNPATWPYAAAVLASSAPYLPGGRSAASWLVSGRQGNVPGLLSDVIRRTPAISSPILPSLMYGSE